MGWVFTPLLSVADLKLTSALLHAGGGAYESNPVAAACLEQHGWHGLALYKAAGVVAFAGALCLLIRRSPKVAAGVVTFGCAVLLSLSPPTATTCSSIPIARTSKRAAQFVKSELIADMPADPGVGLSLDCWVSAR